MRRPPAAGRGRRKSEKNKSTLLRERLAEQVLASDYRPRFTAAETLRRVMDGDTSFTAAQIKAAEVLVQYELPKLQAIMHHTPAPPPPPARVALAGASRETMEVLRDALAQAQDEAARARDARQIEGAVVGEDDEA